MSSLQVLILFHCTYTVANWLPASPQQHQQKDLADTVSVSVLLYICIYSLIYLLCSSDGNKIHYIWPREPHTFRTVVIILQ